MIDRNSATPVYVQLADLLRAEIKSGKIAPGDMLDSESVMIKKYGAARLTVREALGILVNEGLIAKRHGKGSFCTYGLKRKKIDVLLNITDYYFIPYYIESISRILSEGNADLAASDTRDSWREICGILRSIAENGSDGVIVQVSPETELGRDELKAAFALLREKNIPYVMIDTVYDFIDGSSVTMDEFEAGRLAALCFDRFGHKSAAVYFREGDRVAKARIEGFKSVMPSCIDILDSENVGDKLKSALQSGVTAVFCFSDYYAKKLIDAAKELKIPDDFSLISVDDTMIAEIYGLTSIVHPKGLIGEEAAKALLGGIKINRKFIPEIKERKSVKKI